MHVSQQHYPDVWCIEAASSSMYVQSNLFFCGRLHVWQTCSVVIFILSHVSFKLMCVSVCERICINCLSVQVAELRWQAPMKTHTIYVRVCVSVCLCVMTLNCWSHGVSKCFVSLLFFPPRHWLVCAREGRNKNRCWGFCIVCKETNEGKLFSYISCKRFTWNVTNQNHSCILLV